MGILELGHYSCKGVHAFEEWREKGDEKELKRCGFGIEVVVWLHWCICASYCEEGQRHWANLKV